MTKTQTRGHCQCCGREQAVVRCGYMAHHGYEVKDGWFQGKCGGHNFPPLEVARDVADSTIASVRRDAAALRVRATALIAGEVSPATAEIYERDATGKRSICLIDSVPFFVWSSTISDQKF